jgi:hypothetical protein
VHFSLHPLHPKSHFLPSSILQVAGPVIEESSLPTRPVSRSVSLPPQSPLQTNPNFIIEEEDSQSGSLEDREGGGGGGGDAAERLGSPVAPIQIHVSQHVQLSIE